jgi:drug/metabolite transporter (DMT)-like permease
VTVDAVINSLVAGLIGVIAFVVIKNVIDGQDTSTWTAAERAIIDVVPIVLAILVVVGMFLSLTRLRAR